MNEVAAIPKPIAISHSERQQWTDVYEQQLRQNIAKSTRFVLQYHQQPDQLRSHLNSFWEQLNQARAYPALYDLAVDLIVALHPWPTRWGFWEEWEPQIRFTIQVCIRSGQAARQAEFLGYLSNLLCHTGRLEQAIQAGQQAVVLARATRVAPPLPAIGDAVVSAWMSVGRIDQVDAWLQDIEHDLAKPGPQPAAEWAIATACLDMGRARWLRHQGLAQESLLIIDRVLLSLEANAGSHLHLLGDAYHLRGAILWRLDRYDSAVEDMRKSARCFAQEGDANAEALAINDQGTILWSMGQFDQAEAMLLYSTQMAEKLNARWLLPSCIHILALVYLGKKQFEQALACCERHLALAIAIQNRSSASYARGNWGMVRLAMGDYDVARRDIEEDISFTQAQGDKVGRGCSLASLSLCYAGLRQQETALRLAEQSLDLGRQANSTGLQIIALRALATLRPPEQKGQLVRRALDMARISGRRFDQAACLLSLAGLTEDEAERMRLWDEGSRLLCETGATAWLEGCSPQNPPFLPLFA